MNVHTPHPMNPMNENKWIAVTDRNPDTDGRYIIARGNVTMEAKFHAAQLWTSMDGSPVFPTHWQPLPAPPPKPDAFEEWAKANEWPVNRDCVSVLRKDTGTTIDTLLKSSARTIWNAAIASVKEGKR